MPPALSRRALLRAVALAGGAVVLGGCEDGSGEPVVSPTGVVEPQDPATWPADTALLMAARQRVHGYRLGLAAVGVDSSKLTRRLDQLWRSQQERLELLITLGGVPLPALQDEPAVGVAGTSNAGTGEAGTGDAGAATSTTDATEATDAPERPSEDELGRALWQDRTVVLRGVSVATPTNLLLLTSLAAQHLASAAWLGATLERGRLEGPAGAAAVPVLAATRPAVFGLEVVAARSGGRERAGYEAVLTPLRGVTRQLSTLAGDAAPVAPLGYDLPEPLDDADQRRDLARRLVADIAPAALGAAQRVPGDLAQLGGVVRLVTDSVVWKDRLGGRARPFPGMTLP